MYILLRLKSILAASLCFIAVFTSLQNLHAAKLLQNRRSVSSKTERHLAINASNWELDNGAFNGFVEARNMGSRDSDLTVIISGQDNFRYRKTVAVPAGQTVQFPVYCPYLKGEKSWQHFKVTLYQKGLDEPILWTQFQKNYYNPDDIPVIRPGRSSEIPENPRDYFNFTTLSLSPEQWSDLSAQKQAAILNWIMLGGHLNIYGANADATTRKIKSRQDRKFFFGETPDPNKNSYGRGYIDSLSEHEKGRISTFMTKDVDTRPSWETGRISPFIFIPFILVFALLLGPGAVYYTRSRNQPAMILVIIPVISFIACISILIVSLLHDGISPKICRQSTTFLDQRDGWMTVYQRLGIEAPLGLLGTLSFPETAFIKLPTEQQARGNCEVRNGEIHLHRFVLPRTPSFFEAIYQEKRREKLEVTSTENGSLRIVNGLGSEINELLLCDRNGNFWHADNPIAAGQEATLRPGNGGVGQNSSSIQYQIQNSAPLARGCYRARIKENVFGIDGISGGRPVGNHFNLLIGRYE